MSHPLASISTMENTINETNYLEHLDTLPTGEVLELASVIAEWSHDLGIAYKNELSYIFEKPHKFPEIWVPAINGDLMEFDEEKITTLSEMFGN